MTPRQYVAGVLTDHLPPGVRLLPYARNVDNPTRDTVMIRADEVTPFGAAPLSGHRVYRFTLICVGKLTDDTGPADDGADELLEDVLHAVDTSDQLEWTRAVRGAWLDTNHPAWDITLEATYRKETTP